MFNSHYSTKKKNLQIPLKRLSHPVKLITDNEQAWVSTNNVDSKPSLKLFHFLRIALESKWRRKQLLSLSPIATLGSPSYLTLIGASLINHQWARTNQRTSYEPLFMKPK